MEEVERTELEYREGSSDKVYIVILYKTEDDQYQVKFSYGRRYQVNNHSMKPTEGPTTHGNAMGIYLKQIEAKRKKGYVDKY
jgi:predicted DNA-binding WGR domain protein